MSEQARDPSTRTAPGPGAGRPVGAFERGLARIEDVLAGIAALALAVLVVLMVLGVVLRYVVATPLSWSLAFITDYLMTAIFFLALPWTVRTGAHVRIDVAYRAMPVPARRVCALVGAVLAPVFAAALAWGGLALTWSAATGGDVPPPGGAELPWPVWTSTVMVPIGALVLLARLLVTLVATVREPLVDDVDDLADAAEPATRDGSL